MNDILKSLENRNLVEAIALMDELNAKLKGAKFTDEIALLRENYEHLLHYFAAGLDDEKREENHRNFLTQAYIIYNNVRRQYNIETQTGMPYPAAYYVLKKCGSLLTINQLCHKETAFWEEKPEESWRNAFESVWVSEAWTDDDEQNMLEMLTENGLPHNLRAFLVTAIMLAVMYCFDIRKMRLLIALCRDPECRVRVRAKIGLVMALHSHVDFLPLFPEIEDEILFLTEESGESLEEWQMIQHDLLKTDFEQEFLPDNARQTFDMLANLPVPQSPTKWFWPLSSVDNPDFKRIADELNSDKLKDMLEENGLDISVDDIKNSIDNDNAQMQIASYQIMVRRFLKPDFKRLKLYLLKKQLSKPYGADENFVLAECYNELEMKDLAVTYYERCLTQDEKSMACLKELGKIYRAKGDRAAAVKIYGRSLEISPDNWKILYNLSTTYMSMKNYDAALPHLFKAHYLAEDETDVTRALATCQLHTGHFDEAATQYAILDETGAKLSEKDYTRAGMAAWLAENKEQALNFFAHVKNVDFDENLLTTHGISHFEILLMKDLIKLKSLKIS